MRSAAVHEAFRAFRTEPENGSKNLRETLRLEMAEAFEQRKHQARRMGEKAGTKLLVPLFLLLGVVMVTIMLPAWTAFG